MQTFSLLPIQCKTEEYDRKDEEFILWNACFIRNFGKYRKGQTFASITVSIKHLTVTGCDENGNCSESQKFLLTPCH